MLEQQLRAARVIPVITLDRVDDAVALAQVLCDAGFTLLEITLRSTAALDAIRAINKAGVAVAIAAGTVRTANDMRAAAAAGATLLVSPGSTPALIEMARTTDLPWLPGASSPSDVMALLDAGYTIQKLFPADLTLLDALAGPFPEVSFVPTGGVGAHNMNDFLARPNVLAVAGSWIAPREKIRAQVWDDIRARAVAAVASARVLTTRI